MVVAKKPTAPTQTGPGAGLQRDLLALYRAEQEHWTPHELLDNLLEHLGGHAYDKPRLAADNSPKKIAELGEMIVRDMLQLGRAGDVQTFLNGLQDARAASWGAMEMYGSLAWPMLRPVSRPRRSPASSAGDVERRVAKFSRLCARIICQLRRDGDLEGARRFEAVAIEVADKMRRGAS